MGRTYRRGGNYNHSSYGKSLREKRQRNTKKQNNSEYFDNYGYNNSFMDEDRPRNQRNQTTDYNDCLLYTSPSPRD